MKDLSLHILDIVQNSIRAGAKNIEISIVENQGENTYTLRITDDGKGMNKEMAAKATDPFFTSRTTRKVGLGIPLLKLNAERTGGSFVIESQPGKGTSIEARFVFNHIDRLPDGDLSGTVVLLVTANPLIDFVYTQTNPKGSYSFDTKEIKEVLGDIPISELSVYPFLKEMITENLNLLKT